MFTQLYAKFLKNIELLQPFEAQPTVAVALSGGVDSMSLLLLTAKWLQDNGGKLVALTVNHNLRPESSQEAAMVASICASLQIADVTIEHVILPWHYQSQGFKNQDQARSARYALLSDYCRQHDILHLFVGHHLQDSVENFFIKLSRASGIFGLASSIEHFTSNVRICKPITDFTKQQCLSILQDTATAWVEDPSNSKSHYFRNQLRVNLSKFFDFQDIAPELFYQRIANSQRHLRSSALLVQDKVIEALCHCVSIYDAGFAKVSLPKLLDYQHLVQNDLLLYLLMIISGKENVPRAEAMGSLIAGLSSDDFGVTTLHRCMLSRVASDLFIYKEPGAISHDAYNNGLWDNRFRIHGLTCDLSVGLLSRLEYQTLKNSFNLAGLTDAAKLRNKILFTIPVIKRLEKIVSIPNIDYYNGLAKNQIASIFEPWYVSKVMHLNR
jgi:tRNA(Ile)-lysidine synthase